MQHFRRKMHLPHSLSVRWQKEKPNTHSRASYRETGPTSNRQTLPCHLLKRSQTRCLQLMMGKFLLCNSCPQRQASKKRLGNQQKCHLKWWISSKTSKSRGKSISMSTRFITMTTSRFRWRIFWRSQMKTSMATQTRTSAPTAKMCKRQRETILGRWKNLWSCGLTKNSGWRPKKSLS